eukprot:TRINITY_DN2674_c0_g1_i2.p1 TRINITY_DN2674_c0_g1~~TRINITY_DN2674_c0_g1_i2.p1  ORF type:complete len:105 (-),score=15.92 TRINITY_DN2674_c0_g1_i2:20-334(-)
MNLSNLKQVLSLEKQENRSFEPLPFYYLEVAMQLLNHASEDVRDSSQIRQLIENVWNERIKKIRDSMHRMDGQATFKVLCSMEINFLRSLYVHNNQSANPENST